jgi:hypothetical protein
MYCNDNKGYFPTCAYWAVSPGYAQYSDDWIWWQANRSLDGSAIAKYVGHGEPLRNLLRCPADSIDGRKAHPAIAPGQGPYLYSYAMNDALACNMQTAIARTKITVWRAPSRRILLTEVLEKYTDAPVWDYAAPLAWRHGTSISRGNVFLATGEKMGTNVSAAFLDGHADAINDDCACNEFQIRSQAQ